MSTQRMFVLLQTSCLIAITFASEIKFVQEGNTSLNPLKLECSIQRKGKVIKTMDIMDGSNTTIASIDREISEDVAYQRENFYVQGSVHLDADPHLQVKWPYPTGAIAGPYVCYITTMANEKQVTFVSKINVTFKESTFADLLKAYRYQEAQIEQIIRNTSEAIDALKAGLSKNWHVFQEGVISCGSSIEYPTFSYEHNLNLSLERSAETRYVNFPKMFPKIPSISLSVVKVDVKGDANVRYYVEKSEVSNVGFILTCGTWLGSTINELDVQWEARMK